MRWRGIFSICGCDAKKRRAVDKCTVLRYTIYKNGCRRTNGGSPGSVREATACLGKRRRLLLFYCLMLGEW